MKLFHFVCESRKGTKIKDWVQYELKSAAAVECTGFYYSLKLESHLQKSTFICIYMNNDVIRKRKVR
jgi:hypothetical protein